MDSKAPDIVLLGTGWPERALLRAQLIEQGSDVVAIDAWPMPRLYRRPGMKPRLLIIDLHELPQPGRIAFEIERIDASKVPKTRTQVMLITGDPKPAFGLSAIPNAGVGLARTEFIITNHIGIHPMALARYPNLSDRKVVREIRARIGSENPREFFVRRFSEGVARIAAAFHPKPVIVRMSDFKPMSMRNCSEAATSNPTRTTRCWVSEAPPGTTTSGMPTDSRWSVRRWYGSARTLD